MLARLQILGMACSSSCAHRGTRSRVLSLGRASRERSRAGTILVGASLGVLTLLLATPDGVVKSVLLLLVMLLLVAWIAASRTDLGLPAIGAAWRRPQVTSFARAASGLVVLAVCPDSPLSRAITHLQTAGYAFARKASLGSRPRTGVRSTTVGRDAFAGHLRALREIVELGRDERGEGRA